MGKAYTQSDFSRSGPNEPSRSVQGSGYVADVYQELVACRIELANIGATLRATERKVAACIERLKTVAT